MSSTETYTPAVGDVVTIDPMAEPKGAEGRQYTVTKVPTKSNERNCIIDPIGGGRGVRCPAYLMVKVDPDAVERVPAAQATTVPLPTLREGQLVRFTTARKPSQRGVFAVTKVQVSGAVNLSRLGGDPEGRFFRSVPATALTVVEVPEELTR